ncbi:MAG: sigma-70 family RNA polymerase sigma factor [Candidatus Aminicenantes bacterium]|nr:sigma-70 family RNA polymerase sigma factor [Candidatus Aminicenantes bacterium]
MRTERPLIEAGGSDRAFLAKELATRREQIFLICLGYTRNPVEAEELAQDVSCRAWERAGSFYDIEHLGRWLIVLTRNRCREHFRTARLRGLLLNRNRPETTEMETPEDLIVRTEMVQSVKSAVSRLPEKLRSVLVLREYGELSYREIAEVLDLDLGTVMSRLSRARGIVLRLARLVSIGREYEPNPR